jgi:hypothetical protein
LIDDVFLDVKRANVNFRRREVASTLWAPMNNSKGQNWSKLAWKFETQQELLKVKGTEKISDDHN